MISSLFLVSTNHFSGNKIVIPFFANSSNEFWEEKNLWFSSLDSTQHTRHVIAINESEKPIKEIRISSEPTAVWRFANSNDLDITSHRHHLDESCNHSKNLDRIE